MHTARLAPLPRAYRCEAGPPSTVTWAFYRAPLGDGLAGAGETQVVWSDAAESAGVAAEPAVRGGVGSSSGMTSSEATGLDDRIWARTVECRERLGAAAATLS